MRAIKGWQEANYLYNHERRRVKALASGETTEYAYDGRSLIGEYVNGTLTKGYLYADRLTGVYTAGSKYGLHLDPVGSVLEVTAQSGAADCARTYDPWGDYAESGPCAADPKLAYTGHQYDPESGLYYFGARYYDPDVARFTTMDPYFGDANTPPSLHKYMYAYANPYRWVDLEGYWVVGFGFGKSAAVFLGGEASKTLVLDQDGNFGFAYEVGVSGGAHVIMPGGSLVLIFSPDAKGIIDINGDTIGCKLMLGFGVSQDKPAQDVINEFKYEKALAEQKRLDYWSDKAIGEQSMYGPGNDVIFPSETPLNIIHERTYYGQKHNDYKPNNGKANESIEKPKITGPDAYSLDFGEQLGSALTYKRTVVVPVGNIYDLTDTLNFIVMTGDGPYAQ